MDDSLIKSLLPSADSILGLRQQIGVVIHAVFILTRTWPYSRVGEGTPDDVVEKISPSPKLKEYTHDIRLVEGGAVRQGDIVIQGLSKYQYPVEDMINAKTPSENIERFYLIDERLYQIIQVKEKYVTWDIQVRKLSNQTRYGGGIYG